jgi:hypothetical protein
VTTETIRALAFTCPTHDPRFIRLPEEARGLVMARLAAMQKIARARCVEEAVKQISDARKGQRGWGFGTVRNLWYRFGLKCGDWGALVDRAVAGPSWWNSLDGVGLPEPFLEYVGTLWARRQRKKFRAAHQGKIIPQYRSWLAGNSSAAFPGYATCPPPEPHTGLPAGWSEGNLRRASSKFTSPAARALISVGPKNAQQFTYKVPKTRIGVEVGEFVYGDDCKNDFKVLANGQSVEMWSLHLLDLASGCDPMRGHKPGMVGANDALFLTGAYLSLVGFRPAGTTFVYEKATFTLYAPARTALDEISDGAIKVRLGPLGGGPGIAGLFTGPSGGNANWKAPLESLHNLRHNRCDDMLDFPGQTGSNCRVNKPEGLELMEKADEQLALAARILTPERRRDLRFNLLQFESARELVDAMCEFMNVRRDHHLNDWFQCGYITAAFRLTETTPWFPASRLDELNADQQKHVQFQLRANPNLTGEINLNPREVFEKGKGQLRKFTPAQTALLMAKAISGQEARVKRGLLTLECPDLNPRNPIPFGPILRDFQGGEVALRDDATYCPVVNPYDARGVWLYDDKGGFCGFAPRRAAAAHPGDATALAEHYKAKAVHFAPVLAEARRLAAPLTQAALDKQDHNAALFAEQKAAQTDYAALAEAALLRNTGVKNE